MPELSPNSVGDDEFSNIIKGTYHLRSKFFHNGKALPHNKTSNSSNNRFFEIVNNLKKREQLFKLMKKENRVESPHKEWSKTQDKLITFELMSNMARNSITNYIKSEIRN